jgi:isoamylase
VMMNMFWEPLGFDLPDLPGRRWARAVDTALPSPADIADPGAEQPIDAASYLVTDRSMVVLVSQPA